MVLKLILARKPNLQAVSSKTEMVTMAALKLQQDYWINLYR